MPQVFSDGGGGSNNSSSFAGVRVAISVDEVKTVLSSSSWRTSSSGNKVV